MKFVKQILKSPESLTHEFLLAVWEDIYAWGCHSNQWNGGRCWKAEETDGAKATLGKRDASELIDLNDRMTQD